MLPVVFSLDISDHCPIFCIRDVNLHKSNPCVITRRNDLHLSDHEHISAIPETKLDFSYFANVFNTITCPSSKKKRVQNRSNAWFTPDLSEVIQTSDVAWAKARKTDLGPDWQSFRQY